jgi:cleavage and polyadenylation specificity factor subunit 1
MQFLVDTGADVSVIPPSHLERKHPQNLCLEAVNHTPITTYGTRLLTLNLGLRRTFRWAFIVADVRTPIIGADFLHHFSLLVDIKHHKLRDGLTQLSIQGIASHDSPISHTPTPHEPENEYVAIFRDFPSITQPHVSDCPVKHVVTHHIQTTGSPTSARPRRLAPERLEVACREFEHMLQSGIIRPSSSCWSSPLHMVPKRNPGDWRPCGDSTLQLSPTSIPSHTFRTLHPPSTGRRYSAKSTSHEHITRSL